MERVWIYQSSRFFNDLETKEIQDKLNKFVQGWTAHGSALAAKASVLDNLFIVLQIDETSTSATGCSIDKSVDFMKELEKEYAIDLFDRYQVAYIDEIGTIKSTDRAGFEKLVELGEIKKDTLVYDNTISTSLALKTKWKVPFEQSWHARVFY